MNDTAPKPQNTNITVMAFDFGTTNIGIAVGYSHNQSSQALPAIKAKDGIPNWDELKAKLDEWQPNKVVVGLPLNMDGSDSEMSLRAKKFANRVHGRFGVACETLDERLTTFEAKQHAKADGHKGNYKENPIDSLVAQLILEDWWRQLDGKI